MENSLVCEGSSPYGDLVLYHEDSLRLGDVLQEKINMLQSQNQDSAFFLADLGEIYRKLEDWKRLLPRIEPFYAVKCNSHQLVTRFLADAGVSFDCASKLEIEQILNLGVDPSRIVYANPFKQISYLRYAAQNNVDLMTFDDVNELIKIREHFPSARLLLRIKTRTEGKIIHTFNNKFGCPMKQCDALLALAWTMKLSVVGVSFHVGCLPDNVDCFHTAIQDAYNVFMIGRAEGFQMDILDIGGGFPGKDTDIMSFATIAEAVNKSLDEYFPASCGVRVIAEPGRYFVTTAFTLTVNVIAKKVVDQSDCEIEEGTQLPQSLGMFQHYRDHFYGLNAEVLPKPPEQSIGKDEHGCMEGDGHDANEDSLIYVYIINQGIYGIFANVVIDKAPVLLQLLHEKEHIPETSRHRRSKVFGPTCAGCDCLISECRLPEMQVGQWLHFRNMGAYSFSLASGFNGIEPPLVFPVCSKNYWNQVYPSDGRASFSSPTKI